MTLTKPAPRAETSDDTPGVRSTAVDRYATMTGQSGTATPQTRRYYGYDH